MCTGNEKLWVLFLIAKKESINHNKTQKHQLINGKINEYSV